MELAGPLQVNFLIGGNRIASLAYFSIMDCHEQDKYRTLDHLSPTKNPPEARDEMALDNVSCEQNAELFDAFGFTSRLAS